MRDIFKLLKNIGELKTILVYPKYTRIADPYSKKTVDSLMNPLPVKSIVSEISFSGLKYKYYGNIPTGSKQILCEVCHKNLFLTAGKITIDDNEYGVYVDADKNFQILERPDYLVIILERKNA
jgi:hypothetical protein